MLIAVTVTALLLLSNVKDTISQDSNDDEFTLEFSIIFLSPENDTIPTSEPDIAEDFNGNNPSNVIENEIFIDPQKLIADMPCDQEVNWEVCNETLAFLNATYWNTTESEGYLNVVYIDNPDGEEIPLKQYYAVSYDYSVLNSDDGDLEELIAGINSAQTNIQVNGDLYGIDGRVTSAQPENTMTDVKQQVLEKAKDKGCSPQCTDGVICFVQTEPPTTARCTNSCDVFNLETGCDTHNGLFSTGECRINSNEYTPYCYCDDWGLWGVYSEQSALYHQDTCISIDFLLAVCIGGVCLILTLLSIAICCLCNSNDNLKQELEDYRDVRGEFPFEKADNTAMVNPMYQRNWKNPSNSGDANKGNTYADTEDIHLQSRDSLHRGYSGSSLNGAAKGPSKNRESGLYMYADDGGHYNSAYHPEPGAPWESKASDQDVTDTDAYKNFKPSLGHIDPKANYNIKRPNLAVRPTDGLYNVEDEMPSFRL